MSTRCGHEKVKWTQANQVQMSLKSTLFISTQTQVFTFCCLRVAVLMFRLNRPVHTVLLSYLRLRRWWPIRFLSVHPLVCERWQLTMASRKSLKKVGLVAALYNYKERHKYDTITTRTCLFSVFRSSENIKLLFISPELALTEAWNNILNTTSRKLCAIVIDEAHSITKW